MNYLLSNWSHSHSQRRVTGRHCPRHAMTGQIVSIIHLKLSETRVWPPFGIEHRNRSNDLLDLFYLFSKNICHRNSAAIEILTTFIAFIYCLK